VDGSSWPCALDRWTTGPDLWTADANPALRRGPPVDSLPESLTEAPDARRSSTPRTPCSTAAR
jgi:hypothetical protein